MEASGSVVLTILERIKSALDAEQTDKYTDQFVLDHVIQPSFVDVLSRVNNTSTETVIHRLLINIVKDTQHYILPPCLQTVHRLVFVSDDRRVISDWIPRSMLSPVGAGWSLEKNTLSIYPPPVIGQKVELWYTHNGDVSYYLSDSVGGTLQSDLTTFTLTSTPALGRLDRRDGAYQGQMLRLIPAVGAIEERVIETHSVADSEVTVRVPFSSTVSGTVRFEVVPAGMEMMSEAVAIRCALKMGAWRSLSQGKMQALNVEYSMSMKTLMDNLGSLQGRMPKTFDRENWDNQAIWRM